MSRADEEETETLFLSLSLSLSHTHTHTHTHTDAVKQKSLTTATVVIGTCPDMCPEKERYMREDRRRLSWFELHPDSEAGVREGAREGGRR